jgi:hypothetical protein
MLSRNPTNTSETGPDLWRDRARQWNTIQPPLRPCAEDLAIVQRAIEPMPTAPRVLILGVTVELYHLPWPEGSDIVAVDKSQAMIDNVWPGAAAQTRCASWTKMPSDLGQRDVVLCDGGLSVLAFPEEHRQLAAELRRIVPAGGKFVCRCYVPPKCRQSPQEVLDDLRLGCINSLSQLKLRLGFTVASGVSKGSRLGDVWEVFHDAIPQPQELEAKLGWSLQGMDNYRGREERFYFPSIEDIRGPFCREPGGFSLESIEVPSYSRGDLCPTIVLRRCE